MSRNTIANLTLTGILLIAIAAIIIAFTTISWLAFGGLMDMYYAELWSTAFLMGFCKIVMSGPVMLITGIFMTVLIWAKDVTMDWKKGR